MHRFPLAIRHATLLDRIERFARLWHSQICDPFLLFSFWHRDWQFPECLHFAHSGGPVCGFAGVALPALPEAHPSVRQYSGAELAGAWREMPELPSADFADVSARGIFDRRAVRVDVLHVWADTADVQISDLRLPADHLDRDGYRCAHSSGCGELVRLRPGAGVCHARSARRVFRFVVCDDRSDSANVASEFFDALLGAAFGSLLLLGAATLYKLVRKREGMGMGDVKMMAMVGAFLGMRGAFLTILIGTLPGQRDRNRTGFAAVPVWLAAKTGASARTAADWAECATCAGLRRGIPTARLGSFLGVAALLVVYALPWLGNLITPGLLLLSLLSTIAVTVTRPASAGNLSG